MSKTYKTEEICQIAALKFGVDLQEMLLVVKACNKEIKKALKENKRVRVRRLGVISPNPPLLRLNGLFFSKGD